MQYPVLPTYPERIGEISRPLAEDQRPLIWDDRGIPLNSFITTIDDGGQELAFRPNRHPDDYTQVPELIDWPPFQGPEWTNSVLMTKVLQQLPDMLRACVDVTEVAREGKNPNDPLYLREATAIVSGLVRAWSLMMYGPYAIDNGQLPSHIASLQRTLFAHEGVLYHILDSCSFDGLVDPSDHTTVKPADILQIVFDDPSQSLISEANERCPASRKVHEAVVDCLMEPRATVEQRHRSWLEQADEAKTLDEMGLGAETVFNYGAESNRIVTRMGYDAQANIADLMALHRRTVDSFNKPFNLAHQT